MKTIQHIDLISTNPKVRDGRPCIAGTSITVASIAIMKIVHNQEPDEIAADYQLKLSQVYAALAYYYENKAVIDADIKATRQLAAEMKERRAGSRHKPLFG